MLTLWDLLLLAVLVFGLGYCAGLLYRRVRDSRARLAHHQRHHESAGLVHRPASPPGGVRAPALPANAGAARGPSSAHSEDRARHIRREDGR